MRFWFRKDVERELEDEFRDHLERETAENIARGMTPAAARRKAMLAFDGIERSKEECRDLWGMRIMRDLMRDLRYGLRVLLRSPAFSGAAMVTLALGIGTNAAMFSGVNALLLRPLPVAHPAELYSLKRDEPAIRSYSFPSGEIPRYQQLMRVFENVAAVFEVDRSNLTVSGDGGGTDPNPVHLQLVSGTYFATLGIRAQMGRTLTAEDDPVAGGHPFAVISESYWQRRMGQAPDVLSRTLTLNGTLYTIVGVAQPGFTGDRVGRSTDVWFPLGMGPNVMALPPGTPISARLIARIRSGVPVAQAQAAVDVLAPQLAAENLAANPRVPDWAVKQIKLRVVLEPGARGFSPERAALSQSLIILSIMAAITLLIVCANVAALFLARGAARQREMAVRRALGAARVRLARQVLTESLLLSAIATAGGVLFADWATPALLRFVASGRIGPMGVSDLYLDAHADARVLAFSALLGAVTSILFGLVPALWAGRSPVNSVLSHRGPNANGGRSHAVAGKLLVLAEFTLSVVLVATASWLAVALRGLQAQDLGFDRDHLLLAWTAPGQTNRTRAGLVALAANLEQRVSQMPGVSGAGIASNGPLNGMEGNYGMSDVIDVQGQGRKPGLRITRAVVTSGYLAAIGTPLLAGRYLTERDNDTAPPVAIINQTLARFEFGNASAVGKHIGFLGDKGTPREIVGVVKDAKYNTVRDDNMGMLYLPYRQRPGDLASMCLVARIAGSRTAAIDRLRAELAGVDANLPVLRIDSIRDQLDAVLVQDRLIAMLSSFFAGLALLLACLGVFGVVAYTVALRTSEIGIRTALGASRATILTMFLREVAGIAMGGILLGTPGALAMKRVIAAKLASPAAADAGPLAATAAILIVVTGVAASLPIRRATTIDPMVALRHE
jgi:predicted permease